MTRRLPSVVRNGALREVAPERYVRPAALQPVGAIFAVETKLNDWRRALAQCRTYHTWADMGGSSGLVPQEGLCRSVTSLLVARQRVA